jgi:hypothetical protein
MSEYNWINKLIESFGYFGKVAVDSDTKIPSDYYYSPEIRVNSMYPYTFEQTIRVTHYSKPKRRDPSRNWRKK